MMKRLLLPAALLALVAPVTCGQAPPDAKATHEHIPHLSVRGEALLDKPADQLRLAIGVVTEANTAATALARNADNMDAVIKAVRQAGLENGEYETGRFNIQPVYSRRPPRADVEWTPQIVGYRVSNTIAVKTKKMDMAGKLIDASIEAGANAVDSIYFDIADARTHRAEAIRVATAHALNDARTLADAAGLKLVRVLKIELDAVGREPYQPVMGRALAMEADMARAPTPITPGDVTIRATVDVVYEIAPGS